VKQRAQRGEPSPPDTLVVVRGQNLEPHVLTETARTNFETYGFYGVSVFAETPGAGWQQLGATRFARYEWVALFTAGALRASGLELWGTGMAPHYDIVHDGLGELVSRILGTEHRIVLNPGYVRGGS
jgi:hypothetical protein